jgi:hypothetical protein
MSFMIFQSRRKPLDLDALTLPDGRQARSDSDPCGAICPDLLVKATAEAELPAGLSAKIYHRSH